LWRIGQKSLSQTAKTNEIKTKNNKQETEQLTAEHDRSNEHTHAHTPSVQQTGNANGKKRTKQRNYSTAMQNDHNYALGKT